MFVLASTFCRNYDYMNFVALIFILTLSYCYVNIIIIVATIKKPDNVYRRQSTVDGARGLIGATAAPLAAWGAHCACALAHRQRHLTAVWTVTEKTTQLVRVSYGNAQVGEI